jgi:hypothetical protein
MAIPGIKVDIGADISGLEKGISGAQGKLSSFAAAAGRIAGSLGKLGLAAAAAGFVAVATGVGKVINEADKMAKSAQKIGIMVEELGRLQYAADLSGVSFESLQTSVARLNRAMADVGAGKTNEAAQALDTLGVSVRNVDGTMRSSSEVISDVAEKFSEYEDGANKTAIAMAIFGRAGIEMIPMLNQGKDAIEASKNEAQAFGAVMSGSLTKASEQFNDNLSRLKTALYGIFVQIAERVVPWLAKLTDGIVDWVKNAEIADTVGRALDGMFRLIASGAAYASSFIERTSAVLSFLSNVATESFAALRGEGELGRIKEFWSELEKTVSDSQKKLTESLNEINNPMRPLTIGVGQRKPDAPSIATQPSAGGGGMVTEDPLQQQRDAIAQRLQLIKDGFLSEQELLVQKYEADRNIVDMHYQTALEKFAGNKEMERQLGEEHYAIMEQLEADHQSKLAAIRNSGMNAALTGTAQIFNSLGRLVQSGGKKNVKLAKAFGIAEALISTFVAANKAMAFASTAGPGAAFAAYAAVAAKGLAAVASIRSVGDSGSGGSAAGGGGGGSFSVGQDNPAATGASGSSVYISLQGQSFGRDQVRDLLEQISSYQKDGGQVVFA